ncbi:anti-sigma factor family protein [Streptomyces sp. NPDC057271]|uniref:anti-sigma factor family protein n=1 Tax=unclassified Streptomyces TaxID=2593676 RepID=UPI00362D9568
MTDPADEADDPPHIRLQLGAYVLGALTPEEDREIAAHLLDCESCGAEYLEFAETPTLLALVTEAHLLYDIDIHDPEGDDD